MAKRDLQTQINEFLEVWDCDQQEKFLKDIVPLFELYYDIGQDMELFEKEETAQDAATVRLIRAAYLISKIAEYHSGKLATVKMSYPGLWRRMENDSKANLN